LLADNFQKGDNLPFRIEESVFQGFLPRFKQAVLGSTHDAYDDSKCFNLEVRTDESIILQLVVHFCA
jgi:hypothetical protein